MVQEALSSLPCSGSLVWSYPWQRWQRLKFKQKDITVIFPHLCWICESVPVEVFRLPTPPVPTEVRSTQSQRWNQNICPPFCRFISLPWCFSFLTRRGWIGRILSRTCSFFAPVQVLSPTSACCHICRWPTTSQEFKPTSWQFHYRQREMPFRHIFPTNFRCAVLPKQISATIFSLFNSLAALRVN